MMLFERFTPPPYIYTALTAYERRLVERRNRERIMEMPEPLIKFMAQSFGGSGYAARKGANGRWYIETMLQRIEYIPLSVYTGRIRAWARKADPTINKPAIDREIILGEGKRS